MTPRQHRYAAAVKAARLSDDISATCMRFLLELNSYRDRPGDNYHTVWPGETRLIRGVRCSRRGLQYAKREAERKGWATIEQPDAGMTCRYTLLIPGERAITTPRTGAMEIAITPQATGAIHCAQVKHLASKAEAASKSSKPLTSSLQQPKQISGKPVSGKPVSSEQVSSKSIAVQNPSGFALVWEVYPRKVKLDAAVRAWDRLAPDDTLVNTMLDAIAAQSRSRQWKDPDFIPFLCNWLDGHRWEDEVQAVSPLSTKGQSNLVAAQDWISRRRAAAVTVDAEPLAVELQEAPDAA